MPLVSKSLSLACLTERLAGAASGPDGSVVRPSGEPERVGPGSDSGKEVALIVRFKVSWSDIPYIPFVYVSWGNNEIKVKIPNGAESGDVTVTVDSVESNGYDVRVILGPPNLVDTEQF